ncbi:hypothetical protein DSECCO2_507100 [anaerobic digester metagenome]
MNDILNDIRIFIRTQGFLSEEISLEENDSLTGTGVIDSIILLQLIDFLEKKYQVEIPLEMITAENFDTLIGIQKTVMIVQQGMKVTDSDGYDHM